MRICQIVCTYPPYQGGIGNVAKNYHDYCRENGIESIVYTPQYTKKNENQDDIIYLKPYLKFGNAAFLPQLFFLLLKNKFDIVHLHFPFFGASEVLWFLKVFFPKKFKLITHYHMDVEALSRFKKILSIPSCLITPSLLAKSDIVLVSSIDYIKNSQIKKIYENNTDKFLELPFAVDTNKFKPINKIPDGNFRILFVGALDKAHYFKGVEILLKALSLIKEKNIISNIIGRGDLFEYYKKQAEKYQLKNINFLNNVNNQELIKYYQESDILVLPSTNRCEAFGIVLIEAMACGIPVAASDLPGVRKVFNNNESGLAFKVGDYKDLKDKILELYQNQAKREIMSKNARRLALEKYSREAIKNKLIEVYENLHNK